MRILTVGNMYPPHSLGGYELVWESWVRNAIAKGHDVRVLTSDVRFDGRGDAPGDEDVRRELRWYWSDHEWPKWTVRERLAIERSNAALLDATLASFRPDAVMWWQMAGMSVSLIERARRAGIPAVAVLDDYWLEFAGEVDAWQSMFLGRLRPLGRLAGRLSGQIVGVDLATDVTCVFTTDRMRTHAEERLPQIADAVVIPHPPPAIERFGLVPERPWRWHLVYAGRIVEVKGVDLAVEALALLPHEATLTIDGRGGDDQYVRALEARVRDLGLVDRVRFARSEREELPAVYAAGDVTLFPVRWGEPFGLVPLESMAVGRPVIASGRGGSGEILSDGENCLIVDPDEGPAALAARIRELANDPALRSRLRAGGLRTLQSIVDARFDDAVLELVEDRVRSRSAGTSVPNRP